METIDIIGMATQAERIDQFKAVQIRALELFSKKNADYGDAFADYGVVGVLVRIGDKLRRYVSVSNNGVSLVNDESLKDTLLDLHNYAAMALMLLWEEAAKKRDIKVEIPEDIAQYPLTPQECYKESLNDVERAIIQAQHPYGSQSYCNYSYINSSIYRPSWLDKSIEAFLKLWK